MTMTLVSTATIALNLMVDRSTRSTFTTRMSLVERPELVLVLTLIVRLLVQSFAVEFKSGSVVPVNRLRLRLLLPDVIFIN